MTTLATWTDERVKTLKVLWQDGLSASQIATQLGGITRNAVIGKIHRMRGSTPLRAGTRAAPTIRPYKAPPAPKAAKPSPPPKLPPRVRVEPPVAGGVAIADIGLHQCRYVINTWPKNYGEWARFCGAGTDDGQPYCHPHRLICTVPFRQPGSFPVPVRRAA